MRRHRFCQVEVERLCSLHMRTALYVLLALAAPGLRRPDRLQVGGRERCHALFGSARRGRRESGAEQRPQSCRLPGAFLLRPRRRSSRTKAGPVYSRFVVASPQQDQSFINYGRQASPCRWRATPAISSIHTVALYLDGSPVPGFSRDR